MTIKPRVTVSSGRQRLNVAAVITGAKPAMRKKAKRLGELMVSEGTAIIKDEFITDRPPHRRRSSDIRLVNALISRVEEEGDTVTSVLTIKRGANTKKVATMNNGSRPHVITPRHGEFLIFPAPRAGATRRQSAITNAYSSDRSGRARRVNHPGRSRTARGTQFMQRARLRAIALMR